MTYTVITQPTTYPLTLAETKEFLRVDHNVEDNVVLSLIAAEVARVEAETGRALMSQTVEQYFDCWPNSRVLELDITPASSITSVKYLDASGSETTFSSTNYTADLLSIKPRVVLNTSSSWPSHGSFPNAIRVRYVAGYADAASVPEALKLGMKHRIAFYYEHREDMQINELNNPRVRSANAVLGLYRTTLI